MQDYYQQFVREQPDDPEVREEHAQTMFRLAEINALLGDVTAAQQLAQAALKELQRAQAVASQRMKKWATWQQFLGGQQFRTGQFDMARETFQRLLAHINQLPADQPIPTADRQLMLARAATALGQAELYAADTSRARRAAEQAYQHWQQLDPASLSNVRPDIVLDYVTCLSVLGQLTEVARDLPASEEYFRRAIHMIETHRDKNHVEDLKAQVLMADCRKGLGIALAQLDRFDEARQQYLQAMAIFEKLIAAHPLVVSYHQELCGVKYSLAVTQLLTEHHDDAARLIGEIIREFETLGQQHPEQRLTFLDRSGKDYNLLYVIRSRQHDWNAARKAVEAGLDCCATVLAQRPDWLETKIAQAELISNYGNLLVNLKQYDEALEKYHLARQLIRPIVDQQPEHARARQTLISSFTGPVSLYTKQRNYELALSELRGALDIRRDRTMIDELLHEIWLLDHLGRLTEAQTALDKFLERFDDSSSRQALAKKADELLKFHTSHQKAVESTSSSDGPPAHYLERLSGLAAD